jgi:hypothetical protein
MGATMVDVVWAALGVAAFWVVGNRMDILAALFEPTGEGHAGSQALVRGVGLHKLEPELIGPSRRMGPGVRTRARSMLEGSRRGTVTPQDRRRLANCSMWCGLRWEP